jgi:hypothetical protein
MMKTLVMIPAFGCDERLYAPQFSALRDTVNISVITPTEDRYDKMVQESWPKSPNTLPFSARPWADGLPLKSPFRHQSECWVFV